MGVYFLLRPFSEHLMLVYLAGAFLATGFEFLVAVMMLHLFGEVWWDYHAANLSIIKKFSAWKARWHGEFILL